MFWEPMSPPKFDAPPHYPSPLPHYEMPGVPAGALYQSRATGTRPKINSHGETEVIMSLSEVTFKQQ